MNKGLTILPRKILIIKLRKLGDVLGTTPLTRQIRGLFPNAEITFLTEPLGAQVYENSSRIDQLFVLKRKPTASEYIKLCYKVYKGNFDLVIDLYDHNKTAILSLVSFSKFRLGFAKENRSPLSYNYSISLTETEIINTDRILHQLRLTKMLGTVLSDNSTEFEISEQTKIFGKEFVNMHSFMSRTIAYCVQSEREIAQVPVNLLVNIGNYLVKKGYLLYFVYGPGEKTKALEVYNQIDNKELCLIDYDIPMITQVRAIFEHCAMYIGNDGGNKHIAIAADICSIGIFYGDNPKSWTPNEPEKHQYLQAKNNENVYNQFVHVFDNWNFENKLFSKNI